ncbi:MAG: hypothetical protein GQ582_13315 [Methyloprofundus sp.]|nr:hypothetical protein [Methyloprofundus sp.]
MNLKLPRHSLSAFSVSCLLLSAQTVMADSTDVRCGVYKKGSTQGEAILPCSFSQRQGFITIRRADKQVHELKPDAVIAGKYTDENGNTVYRNRGLGEQGLIFNFKHKAIYVYWDANSLLEGESSKVNGAFNETYTLEGISFTVSSANNSSLNTLVITPSGLTVDNAIIKQEIDGSVTGAEIADVDNNGFPEIYVYINSAGSGSYGSLVAYSSNHNKSISEIYLPPLSDDKKNSVGYMGHDEFSVVETSLARRFPIYKQEDSNNKPTGGTRQLQYKLIQGEASWQLKMIKAVEY